MRVKTVPRHLPGRSSTQEFTRGKDTDTSGKFVSPKKLEAGAGAPNVKILNFTTCEDIVKEMNCAKKQNKIKSDDGEETVGGSSSERVEKFKDTYLYQIMTDPTFVEGIKRDKRIAQNSCPYCKTEFAGQPELKKHLASALTTSAASRPTCCACGKSFARKRYLRYHQRSHSERNKYTCEICRRKYSRHDNLTRHHVFHTNPSKFPCNSCERTFARKDLLNKHLKCHENKYKYHCDVCLKYFKGPVSLRNHDRLFHSDFKAAAT